MKWLTGPSVVARVTRRALLAIGSAAVAVTVDAGLLGSELGEALVGVLRALSGS